MVPIEKIEPFLIAKAEPLGAGRRDLQSWRAPSTQLSTVHFLRGVMRCRDVA
jgi:hypothetical protein